MKSKLFNCAVICILLFSFSCKSKSLVSELNGLEGVWKIEGKNTYESWKNEGKNNFVGVSYKLVDGQKKVTEILSIGEDNGNVIYKATVSNQNQGNTISFTLNTAKEGLYSFENLKHDFPKKIQYKVVTKDKLLVNVFGDNDEGFSYNLIRQ